MTTQAWAQGAKQNNNTVLRREYTRRQMSNTIGREALDMQNTQRLRQFTTENVPNVHTGLRRID